MREPDNTALKHTTTYGHDKFGNRVKAAVTAGGATRCDTNTTAYDSYGRFVVKERDCLGREVRRMTEYNQHGLPTQSARATNVGADNAASTTVSTAYSYTPGGRLYFSRTATGDYAGTLRVRCTGIVSDITLPPKIK